IYYSSDLIAHASTFVFGRAFEDLSMGLVEGPGLTYNSEHILHADGSWGTINSNGPCTTSTWTYNIVAQSSFFRRASYTSPLFNLTSTFSRYERCGGSGSMVTATIKGMCSRPSSVGSAYV